MKIKIYSIFLLLGVALAAHNASAAPSFALNSILHKLEATVNLYKAFYEYVGAVLNQGIPALNVPPLDPIHSNATIALFAPTDPLNPNYTDIAVWSNTGLNLSGFSIFEVPTADLDLEAMSAKLELDIDEVDFVLIDVNVTALDGEGNVKWAHCNNLYGGAGSNQFTSNKQLELVGQQLHVKTFDLGYSYDSLYVLVYISDCDGDFEALFPLVDTVYVALMELVDTKIPSALNAFSQMSTAILNDIFALRNITDDGSLRQNVNAANSLPQYVSTSGENRKVSIMRNEYLKSSDKRQNKDDIVLKWSF